MVKLDPLGNYVMYLRKSRADREAEMHGAGETLAHHEQILTALAKSLGIRIGAIYKELVSGETIAARPEMQKLLSEVDAGIWTGALVMEVERLARGDTIDQGIVSQSFKYSNTYIITPNKIYDPNDEFDEEYFEFGLFMSRREYKTITRRINSGRLAAVKEGKYIASTAPYGYNRVKLQSQKGYSLEPDPERAPVVKMVFDLYVNGRDGEEYGSRRIADYLDSLGIKPLYGKHWSASTIRGMLNNEVYTGKVTWQKHVDKKIIENGVAKKKQKTQKEYICDPGLHPAIIDDTTFQKARRIKQTHTKTTSNADIPLKNPLSGILYCEKCGALMTRFGANARCKYDALACSNRHCDNVSSPLFMVEEKLLEFLDNWLQEYSFQIENQLPAADANIELYAITIKECEKELTKIRSRLERAYEMLETGVYTPDLFQERHGILKKEEGELIGKMERNKKMLSVAEQKRAEIETLLPRSYALLELYRTNITPYEKNQILKQLIEKATYQKTVRNTRGKLLTYNFTLNIWPKLPD